MLLPHPSLWAKAHGSQVEKGEELRQDGPLICLLTARVVASVVFLSLFIYH